MYLRITCRIASSFLTPLSISASTSFLNWISFFGDSRIDDRQRRRASVRRSRGAEFEPVAGKGERRGAVAVGVVEQDVGNFTDVELDVGLFIGCHLLVADPLFDRVEHVRQGRTGENRHHGRWCFVCAEAVRIGLVAIEAINSVP